MILEIEHYSPFLQQIVTEDAIGRFPCSEPQTEMLDSLSDSNQALLFGSSDVVDPEMAQCCESGLWLLFGFLNQSHEISQSIHNAEGSYWHAIMHRLEGDFSNSKYWYHQVGDHSVLDAIGLVAGDLEAGGADIGALVDASMTFSPDLYVNFCQRNSESEIARKLQQIEWQCLFQHCYVSAIGL
jgi:hypothetical protein